MEEEEDALGIEYVHQDDESSFGASGSGNEQSVDDEEEETHRKPLLIGLDRPILGYRNWVAYPNEREGPGIRSIIFNDRPANVAAAELDLIQRWQPHLMLDPTSTSELLREN